MPTPEPTLLYIVGRLDRVIRTALADALADHDLTVSQLTTLSVLGGRPGLSNAQLARRAFVSPQSMNEVILALENRGLVKRAAEPEHGRARRADLTAKGRSVLDECSGKVAAIEAAMTTGVTATAKRDLRKALTDCVHNLNGGLPAS